MILPLYSYGALFSMEVLCSEEAAFRGDRWLFSARMPPVLSVLLNYDATGSSVHRVEGVQFLPLRELSSFLS